MTKSYFILLALLLSFASFGQENAVIQQSDPVATVDTTTVSVVKFPDDFKEKYTDDDFQYEKLAQGEHAWDSFKKWLADLFDSLFDFKDAGAAVNLVGILLDCILYLVLLFAVYLIAKALLKKEGSWIFSKNNNRSIINYDDIGNNIHIVDFEKLIRQSLQSGETRLSIRYYYLWLLKKMADRQIIEWDAEKTNSDYLYEIKNEQLKKDFSYLSYLYNYIWYGEFEIDATAFEKAKKAFEKTIQSVY